LSTKRLSSLSVLLVLLLSGAVPPVDAVYTGPIVEVQDLPSQVTVGQTASFRVFVYTVSAGNTDPQEMMRVKVTASVGTCSPDREMTDAGGHASFQYIAPSSLAQATDATIIATMDTAMTPAPRGTAVVRVVLRLDVRIEGPRVLETNGANVRYDVNVTAGGLPVVGATFSAMAISLGKIGMKSSSTDANGIGWFFYQRPGGPSGRTTLSSMCSKTGYESGSAMLEVTIVGRMGPLVVTVAGDVPTIGCWGSCNLTATASRDGLPMPDVTVGFSASKGWLSSASGLTTPNGTASVQYTATSDTDGPWGGDVVVNATADQAGEVARNSTVLHVSTDTARCFMGLEGNTTSAQLYPGETFSVNVSAWTALSIYAAFVTGIRAALVIYSASGAEYKRISLGDGIVQLEGFHWSSGWRDALVVASWGPEGNFTWDVQLLSPNGVHVYMNLTGRRPLRVLLTGREDWTVLIWVAGCNNLCDWGGLFIDSLESQAPQGEFRVLVQYHRLITSYPPPGMDWSGMRRYELTRHSSDGELDSQLIFDDYPHRHDSGDEENLYDFLMWGAGYAPAGRYSLVIWDHGGSFEGFSWSGDGKRMMPAKAARYLELFGQDRRKLEVLVFDTCLMSSVEIAYQFRNAANYMVSSEVTINTEHDVLTSNALSRIRGHFPLDSPTGLEFANDVLDGFREESGDIYPITVIDLSQVDATIAQFKEMCSHIIWGWRDLGGPLKLAGQGVERFEGPFSDTAWLVDLGRLLEGFKEEAMSYIATPDGRGAIEATDGVLSGLDSMIVSQTSVAGFEGLSIFYPPTYNNGVIQDYRVNGLDKDLLWTYVIAYVQFVSDDYFRPGMAHPAEPGYDVFPIGDPQMVDIDTDSDGASDAVDVEVDANQTGNLRPITIVADLVQFGNEKGSTLDGLRAREAWAVPAGASHSKHVTLSTPEEGISFLVLTVLTDAGSVLQQFLLDGINLNATPRIGGPPVLDLDASAMAVEIGQPVTLTATASDQNSQRVRLFWDLDQRDGLGLDSTDASVTTSYRRAGNVTATCIATDGDFVVVRQLNITVAPAVGNRDPFANLTVAFLDESEPRRATLDASLSSDPDGDALEYSFTFGDGSVVSWVKTPIVEHAFLALGLYNCTLKVRDSRGGESERIRTSVGVKPHAVNMPPVAAFALSSSKVEVGEIVTIDARTTTDPDSGDWLNFRFDWGDGDVSDWGDNPVSMRTYWRDGNHTIKVEVRDNGGLMSSATSILEVVARPVPPTNRKPSASLSLNATEMHQGEGLMVDASGSSDPDQGDALEAQVDWGDGNVTAWVAASNMTHAYSAPGTYTVTLSVRDRAGLTASATSNVTVLPTDQGGDGGGKKKGFIPGMGNGPVVLALAVALCLLEVVRRRARG
jgi:PKD repeat protein